MQDYTIYNADSFSYIDNLQDIKADVIITDPPYNVSRKSNFFSGKGCLKIKTSLDFGAWDKGFNTTGWIKLYAKLLKDDASIVIFCSAQQISNLIQECESLGFSFKNIISWQKTNPMPRNASRRYAPDTEYAVYVTRGKWAFNKPKDKKYLRAFYQTSLCAGKERTAHPTQKPLALMRELIEVHTNKGDVILDPFMGSGSTGIAALQTGRKFIGIEKDTQYFNIAQQRFKDYEGKLFA